MIFAFAIVSPGNDLDGEEIEVDDFTYESAWQRAERRLRDTFSLASTERRSVTYLRFLGERRTRGAA